MDIRELEVFLAVAEELNFRAASERLNISQPPLTRAIAKLEDELGVKLFERNTRRVDLTPAGMSLLKDAREILEKVQAAKISAKEADKLKRGQIRIGVTSTVVYSSAMKAIWKFKEDHPGVKVEIKVGTVQEQVERLRKGRIEIAILQAPAFPDEEFSSIVMEQEPLGVLVPPNHRFYKSKKIRIQDLSGDTIIMHEKKEIEGFYNAVKGLFEQNKTAGNFYHRKPSENCAVLVTTGHGLLLTTESQSRFAVPGTQFIPLQAAAANVSIAAYWDKETSNLPLRSFLSFLENQEFISTPKSACLMSYANW